MTSAIRTHIEREIDVCLAARIQAEKLGQTILARLHTNRIVSLLMRQNEI
jgi:hypothetical protein